MLLFAYRWYTSVASRSSRDEGTCRWSPQSLWPVAASGGNRVVRAGRGGSRDDGANYFDKKTPQRPGPIEPNDGGMEIPVYLAVALLLASVAQPLTAAQSREVEQVEKRLVAPCCYTQSIADHMSAEAEEMREEVTEMAARGIGEAEIIRHYKDLYGERILIVPDGALGRLAFIVPWTVTVLSTFFVVLFLRNLLSTKIGPTAKPAAEPESAERLALRERIRAEIENGAIWESPAAK